MRKTTYRLAVDIGASSMKMALWDGRRLWRVNRTDLDSATAKPEWIAQRLRSKLRSLGEPTIRSAVVGVPALVDPEHRVVLTSVNLGWCNYPLAAVLSKALGVPVRVETDIFLAARAEAEVGEGRNSADFVYVNLGTGVSNVRMLRKEPQLGVHGLAANLGHAPLFSGRNRRALEACACGRPYCVECVIGGHVVAKVLRRKDGRERRRFWREYGTNLGITLSCMASLLDPERFVLNGGVCASRSLFESTMLAAYERHTVHPGALPKICFSRLGDRAGLIGAGLAAQQMEDE
jgi:predicted NBD/HSP70 family sugar kinase